MNEKILIIDDDVFLSQVIAQYFIPKGFEIISAGNGEEGLKMAYEHHPDLIILDIVMPEMDGFETCRRLREMSDVPIVMLTARGEGEDVIRGFQVGANDYVKKPFHIDELEARISAHLKQTQQVQRKTTVYDDVILSIDPDRQLVTLKGQPVHLTPTEYRLLLCLVRNQGGVVSKEELLIAVWGAAYQSATVLLSVYISYLRDKLEDEPGCHRYIHTKWGVGYWFSPATR